MDTGLNLPVWILLLQSFQLPQTKRITTQNPYCDSFIIQFSRKKCAIKAGIRYITFAQIFAKNCNLNESMLDAESQPADFRQSQLTISQKIAQCMMGTHSNILNILNFRLLFHPVRGNQTCLAVYTARLVTQIQVFDHIICFINPR